MWCSSIADDEDEDTSFAVVVADTLIEIVEAGGILPRLIDNDDDDVVDMALCF